MRSFLLRQAKTFDICKAEKSEYYYDSSRDINLMNNQDNLTAVACHEKSPTHSKTMAAPGDDDPDHAVCY